MEYKADVIKNQKFEWGRTINPFKCDCGDACDFLNCPKHNYAVKTKPHKYSVKDFWSTYKDDILKRGKDFKLTYFYWNELVGECFRFPKGTYFAMGGLYKDADDFDETIYEDITLVTFTRRGTELTRGSIDQYGKVIDYSMTDSQYNLAHRIAKGIKQIREYISKELGNELQ
jgi:hypothetical protein